MKYLVEHIKDYPLLKDLQGKTKETVKDILTNIEMNIFYGHMGVKPDKSFLLYGPPGTGKTFATKVINNEINQTLDPKSKYDPTQFNLITMKYDIGNYGTSYINEGSRRIQGFFDAAFEFDNKGKKVFLIFDEADVLFQSRGSSRQSHSEDTKNLETLMKNMQDVYDSESIYMTIITNLEKDLDSAAIRSGRIDKKIKFELPTLEERVSAFQYEINQINAKADYKSIRKYDVQKLAELTDGANYADIRNIAQTAVKLRIKDLLDDFKVQIPYVTQKYLDNAMKIIDVKNNRKSIGF